MLLRLKLAGIAVIASLAIGAISTTAALAVELPEFKAKTAFTGESASSTFETAKGTAVTCAKSTIEGTGTTTKSGTFHLAEKECLSTGVACTGTGDASGVMLFTGEWHLVPYRGNTLILFSFEEAKASCSIVTLKVKGSLLAAIGPTVSKTKKYELTLAESGGKQGEFWEYENDAGEKLAAGLLASVNGGAFEGTGMKSTEDKLTTEVETELAGPIFRVTTALGNGKKLKSGEGTTFKIQNISNNNAQPKAISHISLPIEATWLWQEEQITKCFEKLYAAKATCTIEVSYVKEESGLATLVVEDQNTRDAGNLVTGV